MVAQSWVQHEPAMDAALVVFINPLWLFSLPAGTLTLPRLTLVLLDPTWSP